MTEALARRTDPETSHAAAAVVDVNKLERAVLLHLSHVHMVGLTCSEIALKAQEPRDSISPRMKGLVTKQLVEDSGEKRVPIVPRTEGKRQPKQIIWKITEKGRQLLAQEIARLSQSETI